MWSNEVYDVKIINVMPNNSSRASLNNNSNVGTKLTMCCIMYDLTIVYTIYIRI